MQTFLPYPDFSESAQCLDRQRLGKQRIEVLQILRTLAGETRGWRNHPAVRMWKGYPLTLATYGVFCCREWVRRGHRDSTQNAILRLIRQLPCGPYGFIQSPCTQPPWLGVEVFHRSHRSNLLRKDPEYYGQFGWDVPTDLPYVWPV